MTLRMSYLRPSRLRRAASAALIAVAVLAPAGCRTSDDISKADVARWLRVSGGGDDPEPVIECLSTYMYDEFTQDELRAWLSLDPSGATVEEVQRLPRAIEVADHCRGVAGYG